MTMETITITTTAPARHIRRKRLTPIQRLVRTKAYRKMYDALFMFFGLSMCAFVFCALAALVFHLGVFVLLNCTVNL